MGEDMSDLSKTCSRLGDRAAGLVMQVAIADLGGYWLELHCDRHGMTLLPFNLIARRQGGKHRFADVLARLTCKICHRPPARAWLNETHNRTFQHGAPPGWSVQLVPAPAPVSVIMAEAAE